MLQFRLTDNGDPEERVEEAALYKAFCDVYPGKIKPVKGQVEGKFIGRGIGHSFSQSYDRTEYWKQQAFLDNAGRLVEERSYEDAIKLVATIHKMGKDAFIKSTMLKQFVSLIPRGKALDETIGDTAYTFIDGPKLIVQEAVKFRGEWRFVIIDNRVVAFSPNHPKLTPLANRFDFSEVYWESPHDDFADRKKLAQLEYTKLWMFAIEMSKHFKNTVLDVGFVDDNPVIIELNPLEIGGFGLFACDPYLIAEAAWVLFPEELK